MRLLHFYILRQLVVVFCGVLSVLTFLLVFVGAFQQAKSTGLGPLHILQIFPYIVPSLLPFTIPATLLLTVCFVYGRMAGDQEVTAAKAAGINVLSLLWPAFFLGSILSVVSLLLTDQVIPWSMVRIRETVRTAMEDIFLDVLRTQNHMTAWDMATVITVQGVEGKTLIRPNFRYAPIGRDPVIIQAEKATISFDLEKQQVILNLINGKIDANGRNIRFLREERPFPMTDKTPPPKPRHLSIEQIESETDEIQQRLNETQERRDMETAMALAMGNFERLQSPDFDHFKSQIDVESRNISRLKTALHSRYALSCSCFFFVLLGSPFAVIQARRQFLTSFAWCFFPIVVVYYPIVFLMMNLSKTGDVNAAWAMWVGNVVMLAAAGFVLRRALRN